MDKSEVRAEVMDALERVFDCVNQDHKRRIMPYMMLIAVVLAYGIEPYAESKEMKTEEWEALARWRS